ncbi:MAG: leucine--tRNA ligase [Bacteroidales bacterium]|jgi:leucyl-tRNA synthetase|nr:leucine--tRNA ligase [Bacteroidales bacterium]MDG1901323.1 leucine--tRNA ligase [Bacteroidales bacterium]MDG2081210.1 leucine--tRNA ligase [Bacteroidales bacterium]
MGYEFHTIEKKWQKYWAKNQTFKVAINYEKPKFYVLDMFPYPSGSGLHVGHPLGYIASDIYSRFKRHKGFNVLHPMGYDAYGLPAEQYAIQTGTHPEVTTEKNIIRYREQLDNIGFSFDWTREIRTSDPAYYKWTQWTFIKLFGSWYNNTTDKAESLESLIDVFLESGNSKIDAASGDVETFSASEWKSMSEKQQQEILMSYRLAFLSETMVNWCAELGTVLANDEVKEGLSERGGYPVEKKHMKQWSLRITAYSQRLLDGLNKVDWPESLKEMQRNWIGRSEGASVLFDIHDSKNNIEVFTTRPDTIFGATFMVLAPEHDLISEITSSDKLEAVEKYQLWAKHRSERERMTEVKNVSGEFTGSYAINPLTNTKIPIWIADYVLSGYGTGAIMAVPGHDSRDFAFARHFNLPITQVVVNLGEEPGDTAIWDDSYDSKEGLMINSGFINDMSVNKAITSVISKIEEMGIGKGTINFRLRDAIFSRQRYWGEPFPIYYKDDMPYPLSEDQLPLELPKVESYLPTSEGKPPLANAKNWVTKDGYPLETNTMPGFAGSSGYYLRFMDPENKNEYFSKKANDYWKDVDLYIGGDEHAAGHLIYSRFWNKFLFDINRVCEDEPYRKLINQGKIQGRSNFVYRIQGTNKFASFGLKNDYETTALHVDINIVNNDILNTEEFVNWRPEFKDAEFILEDGKYICGHDIEKMSKSKHNVQNPDSLIEKYGADTLRLYEMFLGPLEQDKPWDTNGIEGVFRFLRKLWRLYFDENDTIIVTSEKANDNELKSLHKAIKKVTSDIERFSFNTGVSAFMICVNELNDLNCHKKEILEPLAILISPYAPHIAEEIWQSLGNNESISEEHYPIHDDKLLVENNFEYPVSFNGKLRFKLALPINMPKDEVEKAAINAEEAKKWLDGKTIKKIIVVPNRIINIVVG